MFLSELYNIRYLLLLEFILLTVFAVFEIIPFIALLGIILSILILYFTFNKPILAFHVLIFSILVDAIIPYKNVSKGPTLFIEEIFLGFFLVLFTLKFLTQLNENYKIPAFIWLWVPFFYLDITYWIANSSREVKNISILEKLFCRIF